MKRCAGCGFPWETPTEECLECGRPIDFNRIEWKPEYGKPKRRR